MSPDVLETQLCEAGVDPRAIVVILEAVAAGTLSDPTTVGSYRDAFERLNAELISMNAAVSRVAETTELAALCGHDETTRTN